MRRLALRPETRGGLVVMRPGPRKVSQRARRARRVKGPGFASGPRGPTLRAALDPAAPAGPRRSHLPRADAGAARQGPHRSRSLRPKEPPWPSPQPRRSDRGLLPRARSTPAPRHLRQDGRPGQRDRPGRVRHRLGAAAGAPRYRPRALRGVLVAVQGRAARGVGARAPAASRAAGRRHEWRRRGQPRVGRPRQRRRRRRGGAHRARQHARGAWKAALARAPRAGPLRLRTQL